jgi:hypothetical protein
MKRIVIVMFAFAACLAAQTAQVSGIWNGTGGVADSKYGSVPVTAQLTLIQAGNSLQGTFKAGNGKPVALDAGSGAVSGNQIVFSVGNGGVTANLTQNGNQLTGTMTSSSGQVANMVFTALQQ